MPREYCLPDAVLPIADRKRAGRGLRKVVPRRLHADWHPPANRRDPIQILIENTRHMVSHLLPLRYERMRASPFAFLRGSAAIMAADMATTTTSGLWVQSCGDCHLANFGTFASAEGTPVFDVNDFDETLPAPFEWDLKRLAASFAVDGHSRGLSEREMRSLPRTVVQAYRTHMATIARLDPWNAWRSRVDVKAILNSINNDRVRRRELKRLEARVDAGRRGYPKLLERRNGGWRIRTRPPLLVPLTGQEDDTLEAAARTAFESYKISLPEERRVLVDRYRLVDVAFKVVGIGSVGTFCAIGLFATDEGAVLLLQLKEARASVLSHYAGPSLYANQGQRVVVGQRIMQADPDIFLGWTQDSGDDQQCYVRRLKDARLALVGEDLMDKALPSHAVLCGMTLACAHARSGDAVRMAGYMGTGGVFEAALADFAVAYARQTEFDWQVFLEAVKSGALPAGEAAQRE
ncbi:MAG: DUF2252 domain-containing protein [Acetobacteraceae bacterium]|nr:DUF2252 domain-containing protein [Acetobacteraceae bacterium]